METSWKDKLIVAAIDFGTAFSGVAISILRDVSMADQTKPRIIVNNWNSGQQVVPNKTPTVLLLNPDKTFHSFGYDAENKFAELAENDQHKNWFYFRHFKLKLYHGQHCPLLDQNSMIEDEQGHELEALYVFALSIRHMKETIERIVEEKLPSLVDIHYVLTCPAIWTEHSKQFMKAAAEKAGIPDSRCRIALEPECAAVYVHSEELKGLSALCDGPVTTKPGMSYLIVDMGGGTLDIASHKINKDDKVEELIGPEGGLMGGVHVNFKFEQFLQKIVGGEAFMKFKEENMDDYLSLMRTFETKKCAFKIDNTDRVTITIPTSFAEVQQNVNNESLEQAISESVYRGSIYRKRDKIAMTKTIFAGFFDQILNGIIEKVQSSIEKSRGIVQMIFCVGGLSDCELVKQTIKDTFPYLNVVIPPDAVSAVMKGAVIYGRDESIIEKRVCKYTIGLDWSDDFDPNIHPSSKREKVDNGVLCKDVFRKIVAKGDQIVSGQPVHEVRSYVKTKTQRAMDFPFYISVSDKVPMFIDEEGCSFVGSMSVQLVDLTKELDRYVTLRVFVDKMLRAEAEDERGKKHTVELHLDSTQL